MKDKKRMRKCQTLEDLRDTTAKFIVGPLPASWNRKKTLRQKTGKT